ncbi:MAG: HAD-IIIC family phosphatase [Bosea sp.]|uniref:HAD-IIIC family phosphatase n=1 Tax=Bosea sp. (in: a-proteobacteria) TaxID=1871050 RepID=UPI00239CFC8E|nr:HAD-IIIC family phosphatase [Bosea sp. (in: a-proteobacteria)]MCP4733330.1 HAD-IIIC family phosphatase [Bosea sp. (in: a-proteobacteria)]
MTLDIASLPWLAPSPADYPARVAALAGRQADLGTALQELARFRLDFTRLDKLGARLLREQNAGTDLAPLRPLSLGIVSNATTDFLANSLRSGGLRHGHNTQITVADFGQPLQEALSAASSVNAARPDVVLLALDHRGLPLSAAPGADTEALANAALSYIRTLRDGLAAGSGARIILQTVPDTGLPLFGSLDRRLPGTLSQVIAAVNRGIDAMARETGDLVVDVAGIADAVGLARWHDHARWHSAKIPFALDLLPLFSDHVMRVIGAWRGLSRKVLVLDLDNTLWGGVIGDDGLDGIVLGQGDGQGEAFLAVQGMAKQLSERGVVLAVCSKNDEANAREPFEKHPEMLLKLSDCAAFVANWTDKASNIRAIAKTLALGLDSFVFLDDNPVERDQVRQALPEVAVPELPDDPALYAPTIFHAGYFESIAFTEEDRQRAELYYKNAQRESIRVEGQSIDEYLRSLEMGMQAHPFDSVGLTRITQLINKTNQFNLTTQRCDEAQVRAWMDSDNHVTMQVRVTDKFGDNGIIGVVVAERSGDGWTLPIWLMSCRVLNRRVEEAVLNKLAERLSERGGGVLHGLYLPTAKNGLVKDHYRKLGFEQVGGEADGSTRWKLDLSTFTPSDAPFSYA